MLKNPYYYSGLYKKYIAVFGTLFNELYIERDDGAGNTVDNILVPLSYAPKDKMLSRLFSDPDIDKPAAIVLPRMSFEMTKMVRDPDRNLNGVGKIKVKACNNPDGAYMVFNPVAYDMLFSLYIYTKNEDDMYKIIEQIIPYFNPDWTPKVELIPEMGITRDIPIILNDMTRTDTYEGDFKKRRSIVWQIDFTMKGYFYGPVSERPVIKFVKTSVYPDDGSNNAVGMVTVQPGLTANGQPTTDPALSKDPHLIYVDDDWAFVEIIEENP